MGNSAGLDVFGFSNRDLAFGGGEEGMFGMGGLDKFDSFEESPRKELDVSEELIPGTNLATSTEDINPVDFGKQDIFASLEEVRQEGDNPIATDNASEFQSESSAFSNNDDVFSQFSATSEKKGDIQSEVQGEKPAENDPFSQFNLN